LAVAPHNSIFTPREFSIGIAGSDVAVGIVRIVVQRLVTRIRMKDRDHFGPAAPVSDIVLDQLHMEDRSRQIPFEHQRADAEDELHFGQS
jgi:hypothetical protein